MKASLNPPGRTLFQSILLIAEMFQNVVHQKIIKHDIGQRKLKRWFQQGSCEKIRSTGPQCWSRQGISISLRSNPTVTFLLYNSPSFFMDDGRGLSLFGPTHGFIYYWRNDLSKPFFCKAECCSKQFGLLESFIIGMEWHSANETNIFLVNWSVGWEAKIVLDPLSISDANWYLVKKSTKIASTIIALFQVVTEQLKYFFPFFCWRLTTFISAKQRPSSSILDAIVRNLSEQQK